MLRNSMRSSQKDEKLGILETQITAETLTQKSDYNSLLKVPGLFVGLNAKNHESDSVRSPTSPLDFRIFSSLSKPFICSSSPNEVHSRIWGSGKVGLSILDALDDGNKTSGDTRMFFDKKSILFGREITVKGYNFGTEVISRRLPESLPDNVAMFSVAKAKKRHPDVVFEIGEFSAKTTSHNDFRGCSYDSTQSLLECRKKATRFGSRNLVSEITSTPVGGSDSLNNISGASFICSPEIELSEDYTCITTHGSNPTVTRIFGDHIFECHIDKVDDSASYRKDDTSIITAESDAFSPVLSTYLQEDFLNFCNYCNKKLDGEDIYMYRGEKAFCSHNCREEGMRLDEDTELLDKDLRETCYEEKCSMTR